MEADETYLVPAVPRYKIKFIACLSIHGLMGICVCEGVRSVWNIIIWRQDSQSSVASIVVVVV